MIQTDAVYPERVRAKSTPAAAKARPTRAEGTARPRDAAASVLSAQRSVGNRAVTTVLVQRDWTGDQVARVRTATTGDDWNRADGPSSLLNGHNPDALVGILRGLVTRSRAQLKAHPPDAHYDRERLLFALANASSRGTVAELGGMDAIRSAQIDRQGPVGRGAVPRVLRGFDQPGRARTLTCA